MARMATDDKADSKSEPKPRPYTPSWVDHFTGWIKRLPGPSWSYYLGIGLVVFLLQTAVLWGEGALPIDGTVHHVHGFLAGVTALFLILLHHLDERAGAALAALRPALKVTDEAYDDLHYRLTTIPARATLLASLASLVILALLETLGEHYHLDALSTFPISGHLLRFFYGIIWWLFGAFIYHTVHQLRLINHIYTERTHVNLFRMAPLYALSNLTALTAGSLTVIPYGFLWVNQAIIDWTKDPLILSFYLVITFFAVATFVWPQLGIHRLQVEEKERLMHEANRRLQATITELHQRLDKEQLEGMDDVNKAIASLVAERNVIGGIPTWPWEPEVVRLLITALAMPLGLWLIQFVLQRTLGS